MACGQAPRTFEFRRSAGAASWIRGSPPIAADRLASRPPCCGSCAALRGSLKCRSLRWSEGRSDVVQLVGVSGVVVELDLVFGCSRASRRRSSW